MTVLILELKHAACDHVMWCVCVHGSRCQVRICNVFKEDGLDEHGLDEQGITTLPDYWIPGTLASAIRGRINPFELGTT